MMPLKIGVYRRVSTDDQVNVFEGSLDSQKYRIDEFVRFKNSQSSTPWGEIVDYYDEEGVSAGTTNRPEYQRLMSDIRKGRINMILVSDLTRLSRNLLDFCSLINELEKHKASYLSMKEQFDTSTPIGRMIVYIIIALGQFERETTSERVAVNCHTRALKGLRNGGPAPMGYDKATDKPGLLVVNDEEATMVKVIFETFLEEGSRAKTIPRLHEMKIHPKRTSKRAKEKGPADWTIDSLGHVLTNFAYVGMREVNKVYKNDDQNHLKPWQRYQFVKASWPAIIEENVFFDAQKLIEEAAEMERARLNKGKKRAFLLTGLITCGETGLPILGQTGTSRNGTTHRYYHYARTPKGVAEVRPRLNADELEEKVLNELRTALVNENYFLDLEKDLLKAFKETYESKIQQNKRIEKELERIRQNSSAIWANQAKMNLSEEALKFASDELNRLAKEKEALEREAKKLGPVPNNEIDAKDKALFAENQVKACMSGWTKASPMVRKRLLRRTIKEIIVTSDEIKIALWTSREDEAFVGQELEQGEKVVPIRRPNSQVSGIKKPAQGGLQYHNSQNVGSGEVKIGSERRT